MKFNDFLQEYKLFNRDPRELVCMEIAWKASRTQTFKQAAEIAMDEMKIDSGIVAATITRKILGAMNDD